MGSWTTTPTGVWGKKVSVTFPPGTADDAAIMTSYGGLYNTPASLVKLKPVFSVDDTSVAEGTPVSPGALLDMNITFHEPNVADDFAHHGVVPRGRPTLGLDPGAFPDSLLGGRINRFKSLPPGSDASTTE